MSWTPENQALDAACPRTSCARTLPCACGIITSVSQREMVSLAAAVCGALGRTNKRDDCLSLSVFLSYHFSALTGHQNLSSEIDDIVLISGIKISPGTKSPKLTWFGNLLATYLPHITTIAYPNLPRISIWHKPLAQ